MRCHFLLFNSHPSQPSIPRSGEENTETSISPTPLLPYCYTTQPITHMRTQEVSKDLHGNPFCTFSKPELVKVTLWHLRGQVGGGGASICLVCSVWVRQQEGGSPKAGLVFASLLFPPISYICPPTSLPWSPFPHLCCLFPSLAPICFYVTFIFISSKLAFGNDSSETPITPHQKQICGL